MPHYQPETAFKLYSRAMASLDLATGLVSTKDKPDHATVGPTSVRDVTNVPPSIPDSVCYVEEYPISASCTQNQIAAIADGSAVVVNGVVVEPKPVRP